MIPVMSGTLAMPVYRVMLSFLSLTMNRVLLLPLTAPAMFTLFCSMEVADSLRVVVAFSRVYSPLLLRL